MPGSISPIAAPTEPVAVLHQRADVEPQRAARRSTAPSAPANISASSAALSVFWIRLRTPRTYLNPRPPERRLNTSRKRQKPTTKTTIATAEQDGRLILPAIRRDHRRRRRARSTPASSGRVRAVAREVLADRQLEPGQRAERQRRRGPSWRRARRRRRSRATSSTSASSTRSRRAGRCPTGAGGRSSTAAARRRARRERARSRRAAAWRAGRGAPRRGRRRARRACVPSRGRASVASRPDAPGALAAALTHLGGVASGSRPAAAPPG